MIVGITPGWTQTEIAYRTARHWIGKGLEQDEIYKKCKLESRFAGSMRTNLIKMLDAVDLHSYLKIETCKELFSADNDLLHTTSLIQYPVFVKGKNYSGSSPELVKDVFLMEFAKIHFYSELSQMRKDILIVPLGKAVEKVLQCMLNDGVIKEEQCLFGFPHPSGANAHAHKQFCDNERQLKIKVKNHFEVQK